MTCSRHFLNLQWEHHSWAPQVSFAEKVATQETNMWGRVVHGESVRCHKHEACEVCGKTGKDVSCICDTTHAEHCAILQAWINEQVTPSD